MDANFISIGFLCALCVLSRLIEERFQLVFSGLRELALASKGF